jgi:hypothetical protein
MNVNKCVVSTGYGRGNTNERIVEDFVLFEQGHGGWDMVLNNPLDECLVGVFWLAMVCYRILDGLACLLLGSFRHVEVVVLNSVNLQE